MVKASAVIVIDTREQSPLEFPSREVTISKEGLDTGDYAIKVNEELQPIRIERKSLSDLFSSFSGTNYKRERDKIQRAKDGGLRYILAIEGTCSEVRRGHRYWKGGRWHECGKDGLSQVRQLERISQKYGVEIRYAHGREDLAFMIQEILMTYWRHKEEK